MTEYIVRIRQPYNFEVRVATDGICFSQDLIRQDYLLLSVSVLAAFSVIFKPFSSATRDVAALP
jgi:hypothetical protein